MSGFDALTTDSPALTALVGLLWTAGLYGLGRLLVGWLFADLGPVWRPVAAWALGIETASLIVQALAMSGLARAGVLRGVGWGLIGVGVVTLFAQRKSVRLGAAWPWLTFPAIGLACTFLMAIAGSTKIDEIYYHLLLPARIVEDGALHFYRLPWEGAVLPQMAYQILQAPLHALGFPHAANVTSWALALQFFLFGRALLIDRGAPARWATVAASAIVVGIHAGVFYTSSGAHALGDGITAAAALAVVHADDLKRRVGAIGTVGFVSLLMLTATTTKLSLVPLAAVLLLILLIRVARDELAQPARLGRLAIVLATPWLLFYAPIALFTWRTSGSPWGPVAANLLGESVYDAATLQNTVAWTKSIVRQQWMGTLKSSLVLVPTLVWFAVVAVPLWKPARRFALVSRSRPARVADRRHAADRSALSGWFAIRRLADARRRLGAAPPQVGRRRPIDRVTRRGLSAVAARAGLLQLSLRGTFARTDGSRDVS